MPRIGYAFMGRSRPKGVDVSAASSNAVAPAGGPAPTTSRRPVVTAELFVIPFEEDDFIVYAPLRRAAFVANARVVNIIAGLTDGHFEPASE